MNNVVKKFIQSHWTNQVEHIAKHFNVTDIKLITEVKSLIIDSIDKNLDIFIDSYLKVFSPEELQEISEFFESAVGKKFIDKSAETATNTAVTKITIPMMTEVVQKFKEAAPQPESVKTSK